MHARDRARIPTAVDRCSAPMKACTAMSLSDAEFDDLFRGYYAKVAAFAARVTLARDIAEDVAAEAFVALWERRARIDGEAAARMLLYRTARNAALNHLRDTRTRERRLSEAIDD